MDARSKIRRMALVCASALVLLPLTAVPATAQSAEDCDEFTAIPELGEPLADACRDLAEQVEGDGDNGDNGDENGEDGLTGTPLDQLLDVLDEAGLSPDELCALRDDAPEELDPVLEGLGVVIDELCPPEEEPEEEPEPEPEPEPLPEEDEPEDITDADTSGELPVTGGAAGLLGLGMLGAGVALRRLRREGVDLG